jgi:hypothetical protein
MVAGEGKANSGAKLSDSLAASFDFWAVAEGRAAPPPSARLGKRSVDVLDPHQHAGPSDVALDFVRPQLQTVLPFGCGKKWRAEIIT